MKLAKTKSLKTQLIVVNTLVVVFILLFIVLYISSYSREKLEQSIYTDMKTKNEVYANTILSIFQSKMQTLNALRDDLERYETLGQMWIHLAAHTGEKIPHERDDNKFMKDFYKKLDFFKQHGQLSEDKITPQMREMYKNILTKKYAFGKGMKFFYIGMPIFDINKTVQSYYQYQDSSLWTPDPKSYNPLIRPWYLKGQNAGRKQALLTEPYAEHRTKEAVVSIATILDLNDTRGVLASAISIRPIMKDVLYNIPENTKISIFSKGINKQTAFIKTAPKYIYSTVDSSLWENFKTYNDKQIIKTQSNKDIMRLYDHVRKKKSGVIAWKVNGKERLFAYDTVPVIGWKIFTSTSKQETLKEVANLQNKIIFIGILGIVLLIVCVYFIITTLLSPINVIGEELQQIADTGDLNQRITQVNTNELNKIATDINQMLDNVVYPIKKLSEAANKIANDDLETELNIHSKGDIEHLVNSFSLMTKRLIESKNSSKDASPLTGLPGGLSIEEVAQEHIENKIPFAFCMFDIDNFKPFNDYYGYSKGNLIIKKTAQIIQEFSAQYGTKSDFVGHIGGDDFVLITHPLNYEIICRKTIDEFDKIIKEYYNEEDRKAGHIISKDRQGKTLKFNFMSISISVVNSEISNVKNYIHLGEICAELKSHVKKLKGSNLAVCKRRNNKQKE